MFALHLLHTPPKGSVKTQSCRSPFKATRDSKSFEAIDSGQHVSPFAMIGRSSLFISFGHLPAWVGPKASIACSENAETLTKEAQAVGTSHLADSTSRCMLPKPNQDGSNHCRHGHQLKDPLTRGW